MKKVLFFIVLIGTNLCAEIPQNIRKQYALKLHEAFTLQCAGLSRQLQNSIRSQICAFSDGFDFLQSAYGQ